MKLQTRDLQALDLDVPAFVGVLELFDLNVVKLVVERFPVRFGLLLRISQKTQAKPDLRVCEFGR